MSYILSTSTQTAENCYSQSEIQKLVNYVFPLKAHEKKRLMPIFEHAHIKERQFSSSLSWYQQTHSLKERNDLYQTCAVDYCEQAIRKCLSNPEFLSNSIPAQSVDHIIFISSTGIATPTLDTYLIDKLGCKDTVKRTPIFGLGCAGGTSGIAKAHEYLKGAPESNVLIVCVELCSLTFQLDDASISNFVGTALFGDGASAVLMAGENSHLLKHQTSAVPKVEHISTKTKPHSQSVMGWKVVDTGFEVVFNKSIPNLVRHFWSGHIKDFLLSVGWTVDELPFLVAHPGGKKVLEAYEEVLSVPESALTFSRNILRDHGNMSSPTVHFVLDQAMRSKPKRKTRSIMASLGPGFTSELVSLEWS
ncbi:type III polyketide synthase [Halobacillus amylolyticus]|uniref:Naringenin-chalcone synthase n=1 Tax=Halobacillus amylolyticus TaxID=2932259 RepID=A0ABY4HC85_9BACI|nr:3-oxoacyl-[acyl-carrier-protein] synthase III C-terminal domain-containing protein [Halobacillus amylolyticus]UOR12506.1 naringenin-chalcone synthase [Halobacillus amylolyticus]